MIRAARAIAIATVLATGVLAGCGDQPDTTEPAVAATETLPTPTGEPMDTAATDEPTQTAEPTPQAAVDLQA